MTWSVLRAYSAFAIDPRGAREGGISIGEPLPPIQVPPQPRDLWSVIRRWLLGAAALIALGLAVAAVLTGRPMFAIAGWTFAALPIVYLGVAAVRGTFARAAGAGVAAGLVLIVSASTVVALISCGQRLEPRSDLSGCDLSGEDLSRLDLTGADLTDADLGAASLLRTDLDRAVLRGADLRGVDLNGTSMRDTNLEDADLRNLDLTRAILAPSSLAGAMLDGANLSDADLSGVSLRGASARGTNLAAANLTDADLSGVALDGATLEDTTLIGAVGLADDTLAQALGVAPDALGGELIERNVRLEDRVEIIDAFAGTCAGRGVPEAAIYPQGDLHPMVILDERGAAGADTEEASRLGWEPMAVRFAQLVACVSEEEEIQVEHCPYTLEGGGNASITRVRYQRDIRVVEAASGRAVFDKTLQGSTPQSCPLFHTFSNFNQNETFGGSSIGFNKVQSELAGFVE